MSSRNNLSIFAIALWLGAIGTAFGFLAAYEQTPGAAPRSLSSLPADFEPPAKPGSRVLLMFLHPRCACSQASVGELEKILSHAPEPPEIRLYFYKPKDRADDWTRTGLHDTATRNGWTVRIDEDGAIASRLGAETSGHVMIFDATGTLRFSGGVTASRGHWGDNESASTALKTLVNDANGAAARPVFGCDIHGETPARAASADATP